MEPVDFRELFQWAPGCYLVLDPGLKIVAASDAYLRATMTRREDIVGRDLYDAFPENPQEGGATQYASTRASFERVLEQREPDSLGVQRYDIRRPAATGGAFEERHWRLTNTPVLGPDGNVTYIIQSVEDVTDDVRSAEEKRRRLRELSTPVVRVHRGILLLPLIGSVDSERSEQIMQTVLTRVMTDEARALIVDVAGVPVLDTAVADSLLKTAAAVRLLGAHCILTGIGAHTAKTIVRLDIDVSMMHTRTTLSDGIELALGLIRDNEPIRSPS
jgi:anti-anti-sigma regulatory factor